MQLLSQTQRALLDSPRRRHHNRWPNGGLELDTQNKFEITARHGELHFNEHWVPDSDLNSLLPICPLSSPSTKIAEPDSWAQVESAREPNRFSFKHQPIHRIQVCSVGRRHGQVVPSFQCRAGRVLDHESRGCAESRHKEGEGEHLRIFGSRWEKRLSTEQFPKAIGWNDEFARYLDHTVQIDISHDAPAEQRGRYSNSVNLRVWRKTCKACHWRRDQDSQKRK